MSPGTIRVGIGGWTYEPWRGGVFYPAGLLQGRELEYAGGHLTAIEINATYYRAQKPESFAAWAATVPDGFRFSVKASRFATNRKALADGADSVQRFLSQGLARLGDRLGPILWQFAATKRFERDDFARFLDLLPDVQDGVALRHALEVHHESFCDQAFIDLARARNMAIALIDSDESPAPADSGDEAAADFVYARLQRSSDAYETGYDAAALDHWAARARRWATEGRDVYLFFIAGAKHRNPAAAQALIARLAGLRTGV
jgi:uncharacterized protein YecE (DUF72 family)